MAERTMPAPGRERDRMLGEALGYSLTVYDKGYPEDNYWALQDPEGNRVLMGNGWRDGERASADEAWADLPQWSTSAAASLDVLAAMEAREWEWSMSRTQHRRYVRGGQYWVGMHKFERGCAAVKIDVEADAAALAAAITAAALRAVWAEQEGNDAD